MSKHSSNGEVLESEKKSFDESAAAEVTHAVDVQKITDKATENAAESKPVLYHIQHWASSRPLTIIHELGLLDKIDIKVVSMADIKKEDYLALNPHGTIPILKMPCGKVILESGAIAMHLVEKYGGLDHALFGKPENRLELLQWLFYAPSTLYPMVGGYYISDEAGRQKLLDRLNKQHLPFLAKSLGDKKFLCGDEFTLADAFMGFELCGLQEIKWLENFPTLGAYVGRLMQRPSFAATFM